MFLHKFRRCNEKVIQQFLVAIAEAWVPQATTPGAISRRLLGAGLVFAGISHLTFARQDFRAQVPN